LQIEHSSARGVGFAQREANHYQLNPLPSQAEREKQWADMIGAHGKDAVEQARKLASLLNEQRDPETVAGFIRIIDKYGLEWVQRATRQVAEKRSDNPQRHFAYIVGILKSWETQGGMD
jgi:hypothetical protein